MLRNILEIICDCHRVPRFILLAGTYSTDIYICDCHRVPSVKLLAGTVPKVPISIDVTVIEYLCLYS